MDKTTEQLASYTASLSYADLTPEAVHAAKRSLVDSIGCALGAYHAEPVKAARALASRVTGAQPATLFGAGIRSSPEWAAFANGLMIRYLDFSDDYFGAEEGEGSPHPSDTIAGVLAAAESAGADGKALALGIVLAYEACGQVRRLKGWDYGTLTAIGTSLGAGKVLGLSREQLRNAVSIAIVPNICLLQTKVGELSHWKGCVGPNGSRNGLFAALLAGEAITGPPEPFEGKAGLMKQLGTPFELGAFGGRGVPFKVEGTSFKYLPVMYSLQLPVWTALELRKQVTVADIESIRVYLERRTVLGDSYSSERYQPGNRETADHSGPYLMGAALVDGEVTIRTLTPERYRDPEILAVARKIRAQEDPEYTAAAPRVLNCRIEATLRSGKKVTVHRANPKGHPANPMTDGDIEDKFLKQVDPLLTGRQSRALLDRLWNLERLDGLGELFRLMLVQTQ
ncbi:MAG: MmgE/PrpD family protein [Chloroflexi bacterium]|nr:MmgE/PrpD family protein [Chloroflexota bacterium]